MSASLTIQRPRYVLLTLAGLALVCAFVFMTINARGSWSFILPFRGAKLATMLLVAYAIAVSTVLFQTVSNNRILTPSIMGFDALYILLQTGLVFFSAGALTTLDHRLQFLVETLLMVGFAGFLFRWLFSGAVKSLHLLVLVGIVFGVLFRSLSGFMQRLIDPNAFAVLQDRFFASFNTIDTSLLGISALLVLATSLIGLRYIRELDVIALGRETAINLGVDHQKTVTIILVLVAILVSVSTALVGPVTFFGLLVASLAYQLIGSHRHALILPAAALIAAICLIGGQLVLERLFAFDTSLSIIIEFAGGITFIILLLRGAAR